jgi:hypothetical protein
MVLYYQNKKLIEQQFKSESEFENIIVENSKLFFGNSSIFIDTKKKIDSKFLGGTIPDGFLIDLSDIENPEFYIVEVELANHDFYKHIFPQLTKFFSFFKNSQSISELVEKIFTIINSNSEYKRSLKSLIKSPEIYKFLKDVIENSHNILLIIDGEKEELPEIMETYTDTWGSMVSLMLIKKFKHKDEIIYSVHPDFNDIQYGDAESTTLKHSNKVFHLTEEEKLNQTSQVAKEAYLKIKTEIMKISEEVVFNPQRYYLSVSFVRNIAFYKFRRKKIRVVLMLPEEEIRNIIKHHTIIPLSASVQKFYNGPCSAVDIIDADNVEEIVAVFKILIEKNSV